MDAQRKVKIGLIGLGNIGGKTHAVNLKSMAGIEVAGVCDIDAACADKFAAELGTTAYHDHASLFARSGLEAVIVAVPHYQHTPIAIEALGRGLHVLCEKPMAVHVNDARRMLEAWEKAKRRNPGLIFAMMLQERTLPLNRKLKDIVTGGELGRLLRVTWINTAWFRSQAYYDSSGWRATWAGEGGGILTNQCPHNLDLYQWLFGVPSRVSGFAHLGKYHDIEVEDEITAYFEHDNGMIGHFVATTAESPGTNRLEIVGEYGSLVSERGKLIFHRNRMSMLEFSKQTKEAFAKIECWPTEIPFESKSPASHKLVAERFVDAILGRGELVADGNEGIKSVTIANAIMLSSFSGRPVEIPFDADAYERKLQELARSSTFAKTVRDDVGVNMTSSFSH